MFHVAITVKPRPPGKLRGVLPRNVSAVGPHPAVVKAPKAAAPANITKLPKLAAVAQLTDTRIAAVMPLSTQDGTVPTEVEGPLGSHDIAVLYERHAPAIYAHCRRLLGSAPAGRDALQESFVRVLQHHRVLGPGDQALRYLYRTSTNVCINLLRQRSVRERAAPLIAAQINAAQSNQPVPGDREFVRMLLDQCDETAVAVALMHFIDGMTQVEVAATLGITRRTVYNRIRKIERLAAQMLEPQGAVDQAAVAAALSDAVTDEAAGEASGEASDEGCNEPGGFF
jgi:RNA polymerase sigma-70 factor (ECF subfamily)